jgi:hypothetical protein
VHLPRQTRPAATDKPRQLMGKLTGRPGPDPSAEHGTRSRYLRGCRCSDCRAANADYRRVLYRRNVMPHTRRYVRSWEASA